MAKNVYQDLVMGVLSCDVKLSIKEKRLCVFVQACIEGLFSDLRKISNAVSFRYTVSLNVYYFSFQRITVM